MTQRLRVLVSAYACRPGEGSEPGIGWDTVRELAKYHDLWVFTRENNRPAIAAELTQDPLPGIEFVYLDLPKWARWWKQGQRGVQLHYYLWQIVAYFVGQKLHRANQFDLVHHVTYVKYWGPSFLALLPIPFIWGPVGGGESAPPAFWPDFGWRGQLYEQARDLARGLAELDPAVRITARRSVLARATTEDTAYRLRHLGARHVEVYSQVGLSQEQITELAAYITGECPPLRFISIGRLLHWKGFHLGLSAFAQAELSPEAEYWIVGDGPRRSYLEALAQQLGIRDRIKFWGKLSRQETLQHLGECRVLVHPSLHESGGLVCLEAMAAGRPVICLDLGGPAIQVREELGFKIKAQTPKQSIQDIAQAMSYAQDQELWQQMSQSACEHVRQRYNWAVKGKELAQVYQHIARQPVIATEDDLARSSKANH